MPEGIIVKKQRWELTGSGSKRFEFDIIMMTDTFAKISTEELIITIDEPNDWLERPRIYVQATGLISGNVRKIIFNGMYSGLCLKDFLEDVHLLGAMLDNCGRTYFTIKGK